jgi:predicted ATPase
MAKTNGGWYVITGAPSSGKSTLITALAQHGHKTVEEMARQLIDRELAKGKSLEEVRVDSPEFEIAWVNMQQQRESTLSRDRTIFFDRGVLDTLAYFKYYDWPVPGAIKQWCAAANYKKVFLLELLDYEKDYARIENEATARALQELFKKVYVDAGFEVITVPRCSVEDRLAFIHRHLAD